ncbi:LD-carboxypeptidase [Roseateles asaccharophilus]|uniref:Muramoyltetrapeptide carboxypeptidase n=1 Tax=Roseateles asaccharophilus TaxID=582607 RepID=A0ABU2AEM9_9BURK|nr:LD-carboxypeptidase [Roseateles asaccharophilus]MDR7335435.1 muramoyltetrapeptide carboxypeptidase [Roseateles asaccharophilus]
MAASEFLIPPLRPGAHIAVIAPAGPPKPGRLEPVPGWLRERGYEATLLPSCFGPPPLDFLAAPDAVRLADVHTAFSAPNFDAVLALRGGSGCIRLLDAIDLDLLAASRKLLIGYSDLTVLHALRTRAGIPSLHAPMPASDWGLPGAQADTDALFHRLDTGWRAGDVVGRADRHPLTRGGSARGRLIGGNLAMFCALLGTPYLPDLDGGLLFIEDISEEPYRVDRMLSQLRLAGALDRIAGLLVGSFSGAESSDAVLADHLPRLRCPVLAGWPSGHGQPNRPLPLGVIAEMDAAAGTLILR